MGQHTAILLPISVFVSWLHLGGSKITPNFRQISPSDTELKLLPVYFKYGCRKRFLLPVCHVTTSSVAECHFLPADQILYQYHNRRRSFVFQINWSSTTEFYFRFPFLCLGCIWVVPRFTYAKFQSNISIRRRIISISILQINGSAHRNSTSGFRFCLLAAFGWFQGTHIPNFRQISPSRTELKTTSGLF